MFSRKAISLFIISFIGFVDYMGIGFVYPMFSSMLYQANPLFLASATSETLRGACLGLLLCLNPLTQFFCAPILGMLSDRYGRKKVIVPSLVVGCFGYFLAFVAVMSSSLLLLLLSRVAVGIAGGTASVVNAALADISTPEEKAKNFGLLNMAIGLGFAIGPFLGGTLSAQEFGWISGYAVAFLSATGVGLVNLLIVYLYFEDSYSIPSEEKLSLFQGIVNIKKALAAKNLRFLFTCVFFACIGWSFYWEFTPVTWISEFQFDAVTIGKFYAYGAFVYALSCGLLIRPILDRFSNLHVLFYGLVGCSLAIGLMLIQKSILSLYFYIPLQQFAIALFWPTSATAVSNSVNERQQGESLGILQSVDALAFAISPLIAGPLLGISNAMPMMIGSSMMLFAAIILGYSLNRREPVAVRIPNE